MLDVTVVIPTYNRLDLLRGAVESLRRQTYPAERYEILVVSDGSTDGTDEAFAVPLASPVTRLIRQEKRGARRSAARNLGMRSALGTIVLFLDDDMLADEHLVEAHAAAHARFPSGIAVCGQIRLSPDVPDTPFSRLILDDFFQADRSPNGQPGFLPFEFAVSGQTSYRRDELVGLGGFDESFQQYGWEDIELSYRAARHGIRFYYEPKAFSFHRDHCHTLESHGARLRAASRTAPALLARYPELGRALPMFEDKTPIAWRSDSLALVAKKSARRLLATPPSMGLLRAMTPLIERAVPWPGLLRRWYYGVLGGYILAGYREGLAALANR